MRIDILTLFPEMLAPALDHSIIGRARKKGLLQVCCHQLRDFAQTGAAGWTTPCSAGARACSWPPSPGPGHRRCGRTSGFLPHILYMSPRGPVLTQEKARRLAQLPGLLLLCGHYEGVDQRLLDEYQAEEISIGDYVLTGGELPAAILTDAVSRMLPGVLSDQACFTEESHFSGLLEYPQYTRPEVWRGRPVPPVLLSGHHGNIAKWRREESLSVTKKNRPDLYARWKNGEGGPSGV